VTRLATSGIRDLWSADIAPDTEGVDDRRQGFLTGDEHWLGGETIELERTVSASGNVKAGSQQFRIGPAHAGRNLGL
jgi:hypothetical protein